MTNKNICIFISAFFLSLGVFILFYASAQALGSPGKIYFGVYTGSDSGLPGNQISLNQFEADVGKNVSIYGVCIAGWYDTFAWGDFNTLCNNGITGDRNNTVNDARSRGVIPLLGWSPFNSMRPDGTVIQATDPDYIDQLKKYTARNIANGNFDDYIRTWARQIRDWGHPLMIRTMHELNSVARFPDVSYGAAWSAQAYDSDGTVLSTPQDAVNAWRRIVDIFKTEGADNVTWIWSVLSWPSANFGGNNIITLSSIYPGDNYVDWIGIECYNFSPGLWRECTSDSNIFGAYNEASALSSTKNMMMAEMGSKEDSNNPQAKAEWIRNALLPSRSTSIPNVFPRLRAIFYWNDMREIGASDGTAESTILGIESSSQAVAAFKEAIASNVYDTNIYGYISNSPIAPAGVNNAALVSNNPPPQEMSTGQTAAVSVTIKNTGTTLWTKALEYKLGSQNVQDNWYWGMNRVELSEADAIYPGQSKTFNFTVIAPAAGTYNFQWRMLREWDEWFGENTPNTTIVVSSLPPPDTTPPSAPSNVQVN